MNGRFAVLLVLALGAAPALAQPSGQCPGDLPAYLEGLNLSDCTSSSQAGCKIVCGLNNCRTPEITGPSIEVEEQLDGTYTARLKAFVHVPWNGWAGDNFANGAAEAVWYGSGSIASCTQSATVATCQYSATDDFDTWIEFSGLTCGGTPYNLGTYALRVKTCQQPCCPPFQTNCICATDTWKDIEGIPFTVTAGALGCPEPPPEKCNGDASCTSCFGGGVGGSGGPPGLGGPGDGNMGPGAKLRYAGDGAGLTGLPGADDWQEILGQGWSHSYAQKIVPIPGEAEDAVWLITEHGTFRKFSGPDVGGVYQTVWPGDEYRTLTNTGSGWELRDLRGTVHSFNSTGLWLSTTDRNGNQKTASYTDGKLTGVAFPDGRSETFTYFPPGMPSEGKLAEIVEIGVDGTTSRTWSLTWSGNDLVRLDRPDNTALLFTYDDSRFPGYVTLQRLEPEGGGTPRVVRGWEYTEEGNVSRTWTGTLSPDDPDVLDLWSFQWTNPQEPTVVEATDPFGQRTTYQIDRHVPGGKSRVTQIPGDCPTCGLAPNTQLTYGDSTNPLRVTLETDGRGIKTAYTYNAFGQMLSRVEAMGTPEERMTEWEYDPDFPALAISEERPSVAGGAMFRTTEWDRDLEGNPETTRISGVENGSGFVFETETAFDASTGMVTSVDPPGHGSADLVSFTYDASRGGLLVSARTDPLIGDTIYDYDPFNRRTSETDPNGVERTTVFDELDRVVEIREKGATAAGDLVTTHTYNAFGDLLRTTLPRGNVIEYGYDFAGRLVTVERKPDASTPGERTRWTLDEIGRRMREDREIWDAGSIAWVSVYATESEYLTRCHLDRRIEAPGTPEEAITEFDYDCNGNLSREWDANHAGQATPTRVYTYDALDRVTEIESPWGGAGGGTVTTGFAYDVQGHLVSVTDAEGNVTDYTYSDRSLLTEEDSLASGVTTYTYTPSGELSTKTDARGITSTYSHDALDRVTLVDLPGADFDTTYTYDDPSVPFSEGRLTKIERGAVEVSYQYDRFGRMTQDGNLGFGYDENGNRTAIEYPGGVTASYGFDFADRPVTVSVMDGAATTPLVTGASYLPSGPLAGLSFGNGIVETRSFDGRFMPAAIALSGPTEGLWEYTTDAVGNILEIRETVGCSSEPLTLSGETVTTTETVEHCNTIEAGDGYEVASPGDVTFEAQGSIVLSDGFSVGSGARFRAISEPPPEEIVRTYAYQDVQYFLTQGDGPWGSRSWSYDGIGNRLTEARDGLPSDIYQYTQNPEGGNSPVLSSIALGMGNTRNFTYGAAGHLESISVGSAGTGMAYDEAGRLSTLTNLFDSENVDLSYDGRGYLSGSSSTADTVSPVYSSDGLLHALVRQGETVVFLYLAGRPVGRVVVDASGTAVETYTTDHLGTPMLVADRTGVKVWSGGFEPFGGDGAGGATAAGVELRFPGQVEDESWENVLTSSEIYYNVHRWYLPGVGRYSRPDPAGRRGDAHPYLYAQANPLLYLDELGLRSRVCCRKIPYLGAFRHCAIEIEQDGGSTTCGLFGGKFTPDEEAGVGRVRPNHPFDRPGAPDTDCGPWTDNCEVDECVIETANSYPNPSKYRVVRGPNSNTFAGNIARECGLERPANIGSTPGWNDSTAPPLAGVEQIPGRCELP